MCQVGHQELEFVYDEVDRLNEGGGKASLQVLNHRVKQSLELSLHEGPKHELYVEGSIHDISLDLEAFSVGIIGGIEELKRVVFAGLKVWVEKGELQALRIHVKGRAVQALETHGKEHSQQTRYVEGRDALKLRIFCTGSGVTPEIGVDSFGELFFREYREVLGLYNHFFCRFSTKITSES